jgi:hypothetical protein
MSRSTLAGVPDPLRASSKEIPMSWNNRVRQSHRWVSMAFMVTVVVNIVVMSVGQGEMPPPWVTYSPLLPLVLLMLTGLYLFVLPYATKWRGARHAGSSSRHVDQS